MAETRTTDTVIVPPVTEVNTSSTYYKLVSENREKYHNLSAEWKELRSKLGNLICHMDGNLSHIECESKKLPRDPTPYIRKLMCCRADGINDYLNYDQIRDIFGTTSIPTILAKYEFSEIMDKIDAYESGSNEFNYGDLVRCKNSPELKFRVIEKGVNPNGEPYCAGFVLIESEDFHYADKYEKIWVLNSQLEKETDVND